MASINPYGLTDLQYRFVQEYLVDLQGSAAYKRAGYKAQGNAAEAIASRLLRNAKVAAAITAEQQARSQRTHITQDAVLHEIALLQHSTIEHYQIDDHGNVVLTAEAPRDAMRAISSLKKKTIHTEAATIYETEVRLWNKPASLRMGGEHLGLFKGGGAPLPDVHVHLHEVRERLTHRVAHLATRHAEDASNGH